MELEQPNFELFSSSALVSYLHKNSNPEFLHERELNGLPRFISNKFTKEVLVQFCQVFYSSFSIKTEKGIIF
jgi:hypothetical protein